MSAFVIKGGMNDVQTYTPEQVKSQAQFIKRKGIARPFQNLTRPSVTDYPGKVVNCIEQARDTPRSTNTFQKFKRLHSESNLALAFTNFMLEKGSSPDQIQSYLTPKGADQAKESRQVWKDFATSKIGRKALNTTDFLDSHINLARGPLAKACLHLSRFCRDSSDIWLARTSIITALYRSVFKNQISSTSMFHSALYVAGAITQIAFLSAMLVAKNAVFGGIYVVFSPLYLVAAGLKGAGKGADSLFASKNGGALDESYLDAVQEIGTNRCLEMLAGVAKLQNMLSSPSALSDGDRHTLDNYVQDRASFNSGVTLTRLVSKGITQLSSTNRQVRTVLTSPREIQKNWASSLLTSSTGTNPGQATPMSVLRDIQNWKVDNFDGTGPTDGSAVNKKLAAKIREYKMEALSGAVQVFMNPRANGLFCEHARENDADRPFKLGESGYVPGKVTIRDGDNPFPDRIGRDNFEALLSMGTARLKYTVALGLTKIAGGTLTTSVHAKKVNSKGETVSKFNPVQKVFQKMARRLSMNTVGANTPDLRDAFPFVRKFTTRSDRTPSEVLCKTRSVTDENNHLPWGSVADAQVNPDSYSDLTGNLIKKQQSLQKYAEKAFQPMRGNTGRFIDKFFIQRVTRGLGYGVSSDLGHACSIVAWAGISIATAGTFSGVGYPEQLGRSVSAVTLGLGVGMLASGLNMAAQASIALSAGRKGNIPQILKEQ